MAWPTDHRLITGIFNAPRPGGRKHDGVDIRALLNENVYSVLDGEVIVINTSPGGANQLLIRYFDGSIGGYAHVRATVSVGAKVIAGQPVGVSDGSGTKDPHLHYTYRISGSLPTGQKVNPLTNHLAGFSFQFK